MNEFSPNDLPRTTSIDHAPAAGRSRLPRIGTALGTLVLVVVAIVVLVVLVNRPDEEVPTGVTSPSSSPATTPPADSAPPSPTMSPSATAAQTTGATTTDLSWSEAGAFEAAGPAFVNDIVIADGRLLAVGVAYDGAFPILGPSPAHNGRIWESSDGRVWTDVTPDGELANVNLGQALVLADGTIVVLGTQAEVSASGTLDTYLPRAWESSDGRTWQDGTFGPSGAMSVRVVDGARGYLAHVVPTGATHGSDLWFSVDGRSWELVRQFTDGFVSIDAGDEGFVALGELGAYGTPREPFAIASADGREWHESTMPPGGWGSVVARGPDWQAFTRDSEVAFDHPVDVAVSQNGLDWSRSGTVEPEVVDLGDGVQCVDWPFMVRAVGPWLIQSSTLTFPCSEGGFLTNGTPRISADGLTWQPLPFAPERHGMAGPGSRVTAAVVFDGRLVLAGNSNGLATFWIGEAP